MSRLIFYFGCVSGLSLQVVWPDLFVFQNGACSGAPRTLSLLAETCEAASPPGGSYYGDDQSSGSGNGSGGYYYGYGASTQTYTYTKWSRVTVTTRCCSPHPSLYPALLSSTASPITLPIDTLSRHFTHHCFRRVIYCIYQY